MHVHMCSTNWIQRVVDKGKKGGGEGDEFGRGLVEGNIEGVER